MPHLPLDALLTGYRDLPAPPKDCGIVRLLVLREPGERRLLPASVRLRPAAGAVGDRWSLDREPEADAEVTVMRADVAGLMAQDGDIARFGDNLFVDMDLSLENLPAGTQVRVGSARCEVTPLPHNGLQQIQRAGRDRRVEADLPAGSAGAPAPGHPPAGAGGGRGAGRGRDPGGEAA